ncbi:MAG TPA: alpha/beta fold hydrolase [Longimicrobiales bacterium]|nr:alpha/beta fold hydrolase [Longimicrobiales bacterium]
MDLYYEIRGSGPALLLVEGLGVATWLWARQAPAFAECFTTILFDNRGVGRSAKPPGPYTIGEMAADAAGLLEALDVERAHVLGVSMGGMIAQELALVWPERVDRLVLGCTTAGGAMYVPMGPEALRLLLDVGGAPEEVVRRRLPLAFTAEYLTPERVDRMVAARLEDPQPAYAYQAQAAAGAAFDRSGSVGRIRAPTLVTAGSADVLVPVENARRLAERIPGARLKVYEGLGHQFFVEAADEFNRDAMEFLEGRG